MALGGPLVAVGRGEVVAPVGHPVAVGQELLPVAEVGLERIRLLLRVERASSALGQRQYGSGSMPAAVARSACSWGHRSTSCAPLERSRPSPLASGTARARSRQPSVLQKRRASRPSLSPACAPRCPSVSATAPQRIGDHRSHERCWPLP